MSAIDNEVEVRAREQSGAPDTSIARNRLYKAIQSGCCCAALTNAIYEYTRP
jgi:hypothetical protein